MSPKDAIPPLPGHSAGSAASDRGQSDPYLHAIEKFSAKMDGLTSKADVEGMKSAVLAQTKSMISEAIDPIKDELHFWQGRIAALE